MVRRTGFLSRSTLLAVSFIIAMISSAIAAPRKAPGPVSIKVVSVDQKGGLNPVFGAVVRVGGRMGSTTRTGLAVIEGVPAGEYPLVIDMAGYEYFETTVKFPEGKREPVNVTLKPVVQVTISGSVLLADTGNPVVGAQVHMKPKEDVKAAIKGGSSFASDWSGNFKVYKLPSGTYSVEVMAPGCKKKEFDLVLKPGMKPVVIKMDRNVADASLVVVVADSVSKAPVNGATVLLSEAGPRGIIGKKTTEGGKVSFEALKIGYPNHEGKDQQLTVCRRACNVTVDAEGYEEAVQTVMLEKNTRVNVVMNPVKKIKEREPNNGITSAQKVRTGSPVELKIDVVGNKDYFTFTLDYPSTIQVELGNKDVMEVFITLLDKGGKRITAATGYSRDNTRLSAVVPAGRYIIGVEEWGNNGSSDKPMTLMVSRTEVPDANEPNDPGTDGRLIHPGETVRGYIHPVGDKDVFRFQVKRPSMARFTMLACPIEMHLSVINQGGSAIASGTAYPKKDAVVYTQFNKPGWYKVIVQEWGNNGWSLEPYSLKMDMIEDDGVDDWLPSKNMRAVRALKINQLVSSTIMPVGDFDVYEISLPSAGTLHVWGIAPLEFIFNIRTPDGVSRAAGHNYGDQDAGLQLQVQGPGIYYLDVSEWGNNGWNASPYTLRATFEPADEYDAMQRNDKPETAVPVQEIETIRGSIMPVGDVDYYSLTLDHPGLISLRGTSAIEMQYFLIDKDGKVLINATAYGDATAVGGAQVLPGEYLLKATEWGNNGQNVSPYEISLQYTRAEPCETVPLSKDPARRLKLGVARSFAMEHYGDIDRFKISVSETGVYHVSSWAPFESSIKIFDDRTGKQVFYHNDYPGKQWQGGLNVTGPARFRIEAREWGDNGRSADYGYFLMDRNTRGILGEKIVAETDPIDPTLVTFKRAAIDGVKRPTRVEIDAEGDGIYDFVLPPEGKTYRYRNEGVYAAVATLAGADGVKTAQPVWAVAMGVLEKKGVAVMYNYPGEGQIMRRDTISKVRAISYTGHPVRRVEAYIDNQRIETLFSMPYEFEVACGALGRGEHVYKVVATDREGNSGSAERRFKVSDYYNLEPEDGAVLSGDSVRVAWSALEFGPSKVVYRPVGTSDWTTVVSQSGRYRSVTLSDLEAGTTYEFKPQGGTNDGPVRVLTRVKGLSFGRNTYVASIKRDYNQRVGISVRNNSEQPQTVHLKCGKPVDNSLLLVGFVGEGSEDRVFELGPGEEREFLLALSAQDVVREDHSFPIYIVSDEGFSDEAVVRAKVKLPVVKLEWQELGDSRYGLGKRFRLYNRGDTLTDLAVTSTNNTVEIAPSILHGMLPAGKSVDITAYPRLQEGFTGIDTTIVASSLNKKIEQSFKTEVGSGESLHNVILAPGVDSGDSIEELVAMINLEVAGALDPSSLDWSKAVDPEDKDGDGTVDRWTIYDNSVTWVGDDTDGDEKVDFVHADAGNDGTFDYSALLSKDGKWEETNLVEAWLEMGFSLPWAAGAYRKHDVQIIMNGEIVGELKDTIPEGNYTFYVPPRIIKFDDTGRPGDNRIGIKSKHLRGGHYIVNSDFRFNLQLTATPVWSAGTDGNDAVDRALHIDGLDLGDPDFSVSSMEVKLNGPEKIKPGSACWVSAPIRNLGARTPETVEVALMDSRGGLKAEEVCRITMEVPPSGHLVANLPWKASAGDHSLSVVVDPENEQGDVNRLNNEAAVSVAIEGDDIPPELKIVEPAEGFVSKGTVVPLRVQASDAGGIGRVAVSIDNGLWSDLARVDNVHAGSCLLQPGKHELLVRAIDVAGNRTEQNISVTIDTASPVVAVTSPAAGQAIDARACDVQVKCPAGTLLVAARSSGGGWTTARPKVTGAILTVPLDFGKQTIEVFAVGANGAAGTATVDVDCAKQPDPNASDSFGGAPPGAGTVSLMGIGKVDFLKGRNILISGEAK